MIKITDGDTYFYLNQNLFRRFERLAREAFAQVPELERCEFTLSLPAVTPDGPFSDPDSPRDVAFLLSPARSVKLTFERDGHWTVTVGGPHEQETGHSHETHG